MGPAEQVAASLIGERADAGRFDELIQDIRLSFPLPAERWLSCVKALSAVLSCALDWLPADQKHRIKASGTRCLVTALTSGFPSPEPVHGEVKATTWPYLDWMSAQDDCAVVRFCWDVVAFWGRAGWGGSALEPIYELKHSGRLQGEISLENIELAVTLVEEAERMFRWEDERWELVRWARDSATYLEALSHSSYLVRAAAARAAGQLFIGCVKSDSAVSPVSELMSMIGGMECERPGVAGPFLHGAGWGFGGLSTASAGFDFRAWFLETLRDSKREPYVPHGISLEFHAHEFLCADGPAIEQLLRMGRRSLAVYTATQSPECIEKIRGVLESMASSNDPEVAQAARAYLDNPRHHMGTQFLTEKAFSL